MFNLDGAQRHTIRYTIGSAFAFWLLSQISDASFFERIWSQATILTLGAGAIRVWMLEGAKAAANQLR